MEKKLYYAEIYGYTCDMCVRHLTPTQADCIHHLSEGYKTYGEAKKRILEKIRDDINDLKWSLKRVRSAKKSELIFREEWEKREDQ